MSSTPEKFEWNLEYETLPATLYAEGVKTGSGTLKLSYTAGASSFDDSVKATVVKVDLDADSDRDGTIDDEKDDKNEETWSKEQGAVVYPGQCQDEGQAGSYNLEDTNIPEVIIRKMPDLPETVTLLLYCSKKEKVLIFKSGSDTPFAFAQDDEEAIPLNDIKNNDLRLKILAKGPRTAAWADGRFDLELRLKKEKEIIDKDRIAMRVAPLILSWNGQDVEKVYMEENVWCQDIMELCAAPRDEGGKFCGRTLLDLNDSRQEAGLFIQQIQAQEKFWQRIVCDNDGNGGNIEVTPPSKDNPFGQIVHGSGNFSQDTASLLAAQNMQTPFIQLDTSWLLVGHVDEVHSFIDANTVMIPSPGLAADLLHASILKGKGQEQIKYGTNSSGEKNVSIKEFMTDKNAAGDFMEGSLAEDLDDESNVQVVELEPGHKISNPDPGKDCYLRIENEYVKFVSVENNQVKIIRGPVLNIPTKPEKHKKGALIYKLPQLAADNLTLEKGKPAMGISLVRTAFKQYQQIDMPVFFEQVNNKWVATTSNLVNSLVQPQGGKIIVNMPTAYNDTFKSYVEDKLKDKVAWVPDTWQKAHMKYGEVHCRCNTRRTPLKTKWWEVEK